MNISRNNHHESDRQLAKQQGETASGNTAKTSKGDKLKNAGSLISAIMLMYKGIKIIGKFTGDVNSDSDLDI